jgi:hypothetical protein
MTLASRLLLPLLLLSLTASLCVASPAIPPFADSLVSASRLEAHVEFLTSTPKARHFDNPTELRRAYGYIAARFRELGLQTVLQKFRVGGRYYVNVVATLHPDKPKVRILGAHYDVCGNQQGADDNASGVAGLLEVARVLSAHAKDIDHQVQFVAFANEEPPFFGTEEMGSYVHARALHEQGVEVDGVLILECIGYFTDAEDSQRYPSAVLRPFYPDRGNFIAVVGNMGSWGLIRRVAGAMRRGSPLPVRTLAAPAFVTGVDFSDHRSYWPFGYDALMITDTAFFRNANYHEETDVPSTLDYKRMREVVLGAAAFFLLDKGGLKKG